MSGDENLDQVGDVEDDARHLRHDLKDDAAERGDGLAEAVRDVDPSHVPSDGEDATEPDA